MAWQTRLDRKFKFPSLHLRLEMLRVIDDSR